MGNYVVEVDRVVKSDRFGSFRIVVVDTSMGHRCGYVGIPVTHPLYGVEYGDDIPGYKRGDLGDMPIGDRGVVPIFCYAASEKEGVSPEILFDVHGGITFSRDGKRKYPVEDSEGRWWYGFDCGHYEDTRDRWTTDAVEEETIRFMGQLEGFVAKIAGGAEVGGGEG